MGIVTKKPITLYKIRHDDTSSAGWADIAIDDHYRKARHSIQNSFRISISSDYGSWSYYWSHPGECWREFLLSVDIGYAAKKFDAHSYFDMEASIKQMKNRIIDRRRAGACKQKARDAWIALECVEDECIQDSNLFCAEIVTMDDWVDFWNGDLLDEIVTIKSIDPLFRAFWDTAWQIFLDQLRQEIKESECEIKSTPKPKRTFAQWLMPWRKVRTV